MKLANPLKHLNTSGEIWVFTNAENKDVRIE